MKICHVSNFLPGYHKIWGGAEQVCYRLIKLLVKQGHKVSVLSTTPIKVPSEDFDFYNIAALEDYCGHTIFRAIKQAWLPVDPVVSMHFRKILKEIKPDILHFHNLCVLSLSLVQVARSLKIPTLLSIYDYWCFCPTDMLINDKGEVCKKFHGFHCLNCVGKFFKLKKIENLIKNFLLIFRKVFFNFFLDKIDAFIVLSEPSGELLQRYGIDKKKIHVIHQIFTVKERNNQAFTTIEDMSILYAGWIQYRKGLHIIIEAMPEILKEIKEAKLYVLGLDPVPEYMDKISELVNRLNLDKYVFFYGRLSSHNEFENFLNKANVVVIPELWENMSPVILTEAMAFAKPIVASRIGGIPEFIQDGENGLLANARDPDDFAKKIIWLFKHKKEAFDMGKKAKEDAFHLFNETEALNRTLNLYNLVIGK